MTAPLNRKQFWRLTVTGTVAFLGFWYLARLLHFSPPQFLPMPHEVLIKMIDLLHNPFAGATLPEHMLASMKRFGMGFGLAALIGVPLGLAMGWFRWLDDVVTPLFDSVRFIAPVASCSRLMLPSARPMSSDVFSFAPGVTCASVSITTRSTGPRFLISAITSLMSS